MNDLERQRDSARRWVVNLESRIARVREIAAESVMQPGTRALLLAVLDGKDEQ